jgi:hypothetical protein
MSAWLSIPFCIDPGRYILTGYCTSGAGSCKGSPAALARIGSRRAKANETQTKAVQKQYRIQSKAEEKVRQKTGCSCNNLASLSPLIGNQGAGIE